MAGLFFTSSNKLAYTWDADALAYLAACGIPNDSTIYYLGTPQQRTGAQISTYLNDMVLALKAANLWTKLLAIYPFIGGTATSHKFNLLNPVDSDVAYRLYFAGGITHSATGALPNGSNGYANTHFVPSTSGLIVGSSSMSYYSRTNTSSSSSSNDMGCNDGNNFRMFIRRTGDMAYASFANPSIKDIVNYSNNNGQGFYNANILNNNITLTRNAIPLAETGSSSSGGTLCGIDVFLFAFNNNGYIQQFSNKECAFSSIGHGLTSSEEATYYAIVQSFQTSLGRQV